MNITEIKTINPIKGRIFEFFRISICMMRKEPNNPMVCCNTALLTVPYKQSYIPALSSSAGVALVQRTGDPLISVHPFAFRPKESHFRVGFAHGRHLLQLDNQQCGIYPTMQYYTSHSTTTYHHYIPIFLPHEVRAVQRSSQKVPKITPPTPLPKKSHYLDLNVQGK